MAASKPGRGQESGLKVELFTHKGTHIGWHRALGSATPVVLFKGGELYIQFADGFMRTLAPLERPVIAMIASAVVK